MFYIPQLHVCLCVSLFSLPSTPNWRGSRLPLLEHGYVGGLFLLKQCPSPRSCQIVACVSVTIPCLQCKVPCVYDMFKFRDFSLYTHVLHRWAGCSSNYCNWPHLWLETAKCVACRQFEIHASFYCYNNSWHYNCILLSCSFKLADCH